MSKRIDPDFTPPPQYIQTTNSNSSWVNVTVTRKDADGSTSQTSHLEPRVKG